MSEPLPPLFQYTPLLKPRNIRILIVHPATRASHAIKCSFKQISLDNVANDDKGYEALSYTWGAPKGTQPIDCEGRVICVTPNCEQALLHLRHAFKPRYLWIDAVCIDQQSISEKNQQVPMMGDIYHCATSSILWLGSAQDDDLLGILRRAARYGTAGEGMRRAFRRVRPSTSNGEDEGYWQIPILPRTEGEKISALCANEWFYRMWTIQEFLLSKSAVFVMGNTKCPAVAFYTYYRLGKDLVRRTDLEHYRIRNSLLTLSPRSVEDRGFRNLMSILVELAGLNKATDARDKVYGMIAFLKHRWPEIQLPNVDYTKTIAEVYEEFTRFLIATTKTLWPLQIVNELPEQEPNNLPSWVLDLRDSDRLAPDWTSLSKFLHRRQTGCIWPKTQYHDPRGQSKPGQLWVRAMRLGKVTSASSRMPFWGDEVDKESAKNLDQARLECLSEWTAFAADLDVTGDHSQSPYFGKFSDPEPSRDRWEPLAPPITEPYTRAVHEYTEQLSYLRLRHEPDDNVSVDSWPPSNYDKRLKRMKKKKEQKKKDANKDSTYMDDENRTHDRCKLFLMSTGHLGECPGDVQVGDGVWVIEGAEFPIVLRRQEKKFHVVAKAVVWKKVAKEWDPGNWDEDTPVYEIVLV